ncbi:helix-turn-helix domain-containing protein [Paucihalobacter ruber]|uniref:Helix-turn-helix domain-containing protein n=1 Tax=Paucihalobacter ruber TaxID=2567861 RepID=A0A506PGL6_9FLAO|nr:helix-turn-helix domain-containing protein [Paucihalobacter ruber]TPV32749.1 helix-turn-helix domain-containing protein [Paucihalobacter ruber]
MNSDTIKISRITKKITSKQKEDCCVLCWVKNEVEALIINQQQYRNIANSIFFLGPELQWQILNNDHFTSNGYIIYLPKSILNNPIFKNLHINEVRFFSNGEIPKINLAPGIEKRIQAIIEMLDELVSTNLKNKEDAILALLKTLFIYCDGKCNIKSVITDNNARSALVYKFKKMVDQHISEFHKVSEYANLLHISNKYLNECVNDVLGVNAKSLIDEQLVMQSRHALKFTDRTVKEIAYDLGFSSPDYFSSFCKKHMGLAPSEFRRL